MNKRTGGTTEEKGALPNPHVKRAAIGLAVLEQLPADGEWIFNDPNQDVVITRGADCRAGALCAEHPGICRRVLFAVPGPQVRHCICSGSQEEEGDGQRRRLCSVLASSVLRSYKYFQKWSVFSILLPALARNPGLYESERDLIRRESAMKGGDSFQFSGKLTSSQHHCEDIIFARALLPRYLQDLWEFVLDIWVRPR